MSFQWYLVRRVGLAVLTAYLMLSLVFGFVAFTADPNEALIIYGLGGASDEEAQEAIQEFRESRNLDKPVSERYVDWLVDVTTLNWGESFRTGRPVLPTVTGALGTTLTYMLPAMLLSMLGGVAVGLYSATNRGELPDFVGSGLGYLGLGLPSFWIAAVLELVFVVPLAVEIRARGGFDPALAQQADQYSMIIAVVAMSVTLFAGQMRYARAEAIEYIGTEFIKVIRAKGAGSLRVARHVLRNAAIPLVSLFFTDLLAVLVVNIFVIEYVLGIGGLGNLAFGAIQNRDMPVIIGSTMAIVLIGIAGNLVQDLAYTALDPRVEYE